MTVITHRNFGQSSKQQSLSTVIQHPQLQFDNIENHYEAKDARGNCSFHCLSRLRRTSATNSTHWHSHATHRVELMMKQPRGAGSQLVVTKTGFTAVMAMPSQHWTCFAHTSRLSPLRHSAGMYLLLFYSPLPALLLIGAYIRNLGACQLRQSQWPHTSVHLPATELALHLHLLHAWTCLQHTTCPQLQQWQWREIYGQVL